MKSIERDLEIKRLRDQGETLLGIAKRFNLSKERVRIIILDTENLSPICRELLHLGFSKQDALYFSKVLSEQHCNSIQEFKQLHIEQFFLYSSGMNNCRFQKLLYLYDEDRYKLFGFLYDCLSAKMARKFFELFTLSGIDTLEDFIQVRIEKFYIKKGIGDRTIRSLKNLQNVVKERECFNYENSAE